MQGQERCGGWGVRRERSARPRLGTREMMQPFLIYLHCVPSLWSGAWPGVRTLKELHHEIDQHDEVDDCVGPQDRGHDLPVKESQPDCGAARNKGTVLAKNGSENTSERHYLSEERQQKHKRKARSWPRHERSRRKAVGRLYEPAGTSTHSHARRCGPRVGMRKKRTRRL